MSATVSNEQILAAAVGKAIAEAVTPELTVSVFTDAFKSFMERPINNYGGDKTTRAQETLAEALKMALRERAEEFLKQPEQATVLNGMVADSFKMLVESGKLQAACQDAVSRMFQNISLR